jgi:hypothetical protein
MAPRNFGSFMECDYLQPTCGCLSEVTDVSSPNQKCVNSAISMMIGMGTPRNSKSRDRIGFSGWNDLGSFQISLRRPPYVAARLATKAPESSEMNSHNAA